MDVMYVVTVLVLLLLAISFALAATVTTPANNVPPTTRTYRTAIFTHDHTGTIGAGALSDTVRVLCTRATAATTLGLVALTVALLSAGGASVLRARLSSITAVTALAATGAVSVVGKGATTGRTSKTIVNCSGTNTATAVVLLSVRQLLPLILGIAAMLPGET
uniref:Uncharacterized protein n=1 Tax=Anopheles culicifacies TaxID=139723 RepID=A0A182M447_9DIPT